MDRLLRNTRSMYMVLFTSNASPPVHRVHYSGKRRQNLSNGQAIFLFLVGKNRADVTEKNSAALKNTLKGKREPGI